MSQIEHNLKDAIRAMLNALEGRPVDKVELDAAVKAAREALSQYDGALTKSGTFGIPTYAIK